MRTRFLLVLVPVVLGLTGCGSGNNRSSQALTGRLTLNNQPISHATVVVAAGDQEISGPTSKDGVYTIYAPPKGKLRFKVYTVPPPPPGMPPPPPMPGQPVIPTKYQQFGNDLSFEYTGGKQKFDIALKP
jgi:hypothetical protein